MLFFSFFFFLDENSHGHADKFDDYDVKPGWTISGMGDAQNRGTPVHQTIRLRCTSSRGIKEPSNIRVTAHHDDFFSPWSTTKAYTFFYYY